MAVTTVVNAYLRRKPLDTSRAAVEAKARKSRLATTATLTLGGITGATVAHFAGLTVAAGLWAAVIGIFIFVGLLLGPLLARKRELARQFRHYRG
jgi:hypothetical protein